MCLSVCVCECNPRAKNTTHHLCSKTPSCSPKLLVGPVIPLYNITPGPPPPPDETLTVPEVINKTPNADLLPDTKTIYLSVYPYLYCPGTVLVVVVDFLSQIFLSLPSNKLLIRPVFEGSCQKYNRPRSDSLQQGSLNELFTIELGKQMQIGEANAIIFRCLWRK